MKPQLWSNLRRSIALYILCAAVFALPASAAFPSCSATSLPTGPTTYLASSAGSSAAGTVFVIDAAANKVACVITVGKTPVNLAVSPDSSLLFVENDTDGTVSVINLTTGSVSSTLTLTGVTPPMTANLAVSPDNSRVYVVSLPATLTASTQASLNVISLPALTVSSAISVVAPAPATATPVTGPGLGIAFTPDATGAFIATEGLTYKVTTTSDSVSSTVSANGGTAAVDQNGSFAYIVDVAASGSTPMSQITVSNNALSTLTSITPVCNQGNTVAIPPPPKANLAYYSCPGNASFSLSSFIQAIDFTSATPSAAVEHVTVSSTGAHPQGIAVTSDGKAAYVALDDGTVAIVNTSVSPNTLSSTAISAGGLPGGIAHRPVKLPSLTPATTSVVSGGTQQFSSSVLYAFSTGSTPIWAVNGTVGGNSTVGTISTSGLYTAPSTIPSPAQVTVSVTSSEILNIKLYPLKATVTITPSQLVFTTTPVTVVAGSCSAAITVQSRDSLNNPANPSSTETLTLASNSTGITTFFSDNICTATIASASIPTTANSATFYYKDTKSGSPTITVNGSGSFTSAPTQIEAVNPGPASKLAVAGYPSSFTPGTPNNFTVTAKDTFGNTATGYNGAVHFTSSDTQAVLPADYTFVVADAGTHIFSATLKTAGTQSITATDKATGSITGTQAGITSGTVVASTLVVAGFTSPVTAGTSSSFTVTAKDGIGNIATGYAGTVHFTSTDPLAVLPTNYTFVAADGGTHTFSATLKTATTGAATQSITATDTVTSSITGTQAGITVNPGPASTLIVAGFTSPVTAGTPSSFTVTAKDSSGNIATGYAGTVHFTSTDPLAVLPVNYTFVVADAGTHIFSATLKTSGAQSITATDTTTSSITGTQGITVNPGPASTLTVTFASPATAGTASNLTVTAKDTFGNVATGYAGTVHFTSTDAQAMLPANYTFVVADAGTHIFSATLKTATTGAATQSITATDTTAASITGTQSGITVNPGPASLLIVAGFTSPVTAGTPSNFTVTAKDSSGNIATGYAGTVHFTSTDPLVVLPVNYTFVVADAGTHIFSATLKTAGAQSITATDTTTGSINGTQAGITVNPGPASTLIVAGFTSPVIAGTPSNLTVTAKDTFGNLATGYAGTVHFTSTDPLAVLPVNYTFVVADAGTHIFSATLKTATTGAATQSITATDTATASIIGTQPSIIVNPAASSKLIFGQQPTTTTAGQTITPAVTVQVQDQFGNLVTSDGSTVKITISNGGSSTSVAALNGIATFSNLVPTRSGSLTLGASDTTPTALTGATSANFAVTGDPAALTPAGAPGSSPTNQLNIPLTQNTAMSTINLLGPAPSDGVTFTISCKVTTTSAAVTPPGCSPSLTSTTGTDGSVPGTTAGVTPITVTLSVVRTAALPPPAEYNNPFLGPRTVLTGTRKLGLVLALILLGLIWTRFVPSSGLRTRRGFTFIFLLCLAVGWMSACTQFSTPTTPTTPIPPTSPGTGTAVITISPSGGGPGSDAYSQQTVTIYFNIQ